MSIDWPQRNPISLAAGAACLFAFAQPSFASPQAAGAQGAPGKAGAGAGPGITVEILRSPAGPRSAAPDITTTAKGEVLLSWVERRNRAGGATLLFARLNGSRWSEPMEIVTSPTMFVNWADCPTITGLPDGTLIACWLDKAGMGKHGYGIQFSLSRDGGKTWSPGKFPHTDMSSVEHGFVSVAPTGANGFALVWLDGRDMAGKPKGKGKTALFSRTVLANGTMGPEQKVDAMVCSCCQTAMVRTAGGGLLAAYRDRSKVNVRDISLVAHSASGWSSPQNLFPDNWVMSGCPVNGPVLAASGTATAAAWFTGARDGGSVSVSFGPTRAGGPFGDPLRVDDGAPEGRVDAVFARDDALLVSWKEVRGTDDAWMARCIVRGAEGAPRVGPATRIASAAGGRNAGFARLARNGNQMLITWTDTSAGNRVKTAWLRIKN